MSLTSRSLEYLVAAAGLLSVVVTVVLWPRLAGRRAAAVLGRFAVIGLTQALLVSSLALYVNDDFGFYGSWDELLGDNPTAPVAVDQGGGDGTVAVDHGPGSLVQPEPPMGLDTVRDLPAGPADQVGRVESVRIVGRRTGVVDPAFVYLPAEYFRPQYHWQRFPVTVVLAGYPGSTLSLARNLRVPQLAWRLQRAGRMPPTVVVMIRPTIAPPRDTECVDVPGGPQAETFFARDLPDALKSAYRIGHGPTSWSVLGYSTGGTCALQLAMRHPHVYPNAVALSPDYRVRSDRWTGDLFHGDRALEAGHDVFWRLGHLPAPRVSVLVASSRKGEQDYRDTERFLKAVRAPMHADSIILPEGSHNFSSWLREMPASLRWLGRQLLMPQDQVPRPGARRVRPVAPPPGPARDSAAVARPADTRHRAGGGV